VITVASASRLTAAWVVRAVPPAPDRP
jgi:hypothetical protein